MPTRFEIERALESSALPQTARDIGFALCRRMAAGTDEIPGQHSPSLTMLARVVGVHRRTIMRHLQLLAGAGWIERHRPDPHRARTQHHVTRYTVTIPATTGSSQPAAERERSSSAPAVDPEVQLVVTELQARTGTAVSAEWAGKIRAELLARPGIRDPAAWIRKCVRAEKNPHRWLPTVQPPPWPELREQLARETAT